MRFQSYFNSAIKIIGLYDGAVPLSHFIKKYFSDNKKHGSKDRKFIAQACYNYYRIGFLLNDLSKEERLKIALLLCNENAGGWDLLYDERWLQQWSLLLNERIDFIQSIYSQFLLKDIFPWNKELSDEMDKNDFILSHLIQPDVFLRARPGEYKNVINKLQQHEILFGEKFENCIAVSNSTGLNNIIKIDEEAVIQDLSSQRIKEFLQIVQSQIGNQPSEISVWDCCAGSGGKSILAYDTFDNIKLTASDVRASIIHNLKERFANAKIKNYKALAGDITNFKFPITNSGFDLIICDAPCSGSGTWSRTPEQLYFFQSNKIDEYSSLQKKIVSNAMHHLKQNGFFLYITCSVFKKENETVVEYIKNKLQLTLLQSELLKGYDKKADTMFAALFKNVN